MKTLLLSLLAVVAAAGVSGAPMEIDRAASAMAGMEAQFTHRFTPKGFKNSQTESGSVIFGTLPRMRWSYTRPEEKLFIFDVRTSWFYVPADKLVTVGEVDDSRRRELPFLLLGDPAARDRVFVVKEKAQKNAITATLQARDKGAMIPAVTVTTDPATHLIRRIEYSDRNGNRTVFDFSGYRRADAAAALFQFNPPPGVQVVRAE
jgi:outer membrane lipoprotein carrier protein